MGRLIRVAFIVATLSFFAAAPASAGPYMSWGQWTSDPGVAFAQCWNRGSQALGAAGLSAIQDGRFFHGSNDAFTASLICYDLGNNRFILTIVVAQSGSSSMTTDQVRDVMLGVIFGSGGGAACAASPVGTWNWWNGGTATFYSNGSATTSSGFSGNWERMNDGSFHVHWNYPSDDYFRISADGRSMPGNYNGTAGTSTRQGSC